MSVIKKEKPEIIQPKKMGLLVENPVYKPFRYPKGSIFVSFFMLIFLYFF